MKGRGQDIVFADENGEAVAVCKHFDSRSSLYNARRAYIDHLQWAAGDFGFSYLNAAVNLPSISVALYSGIENGQALLRWIANFFGKQNASGACAEGGLLAHEGLQRIKEAIAGQKFQERRRFAAGDYKTVNVGQLFRFANKDGFCSGLAQGLGVSSVVALDGKNSDAELRGISRSWSHPFFLRASSRSSCWISSGAAKKLVS